jgi:hypothetical protein
MSPWKWRFTGIGSGVAAIIAVSALSLSPVACNTAQASVCFTTPSGCYCIDFFLTDIKEMIINKAQEAVQHKINEQEFYKNYGINEFSPDIGSETIYRGYEHNGLYREAFTKSFVERARESTSVNQEGVADPFGETRNGQERIVRARVYQAPESLTPYPSSRNPDIAEAQGEDIANWTDQILLGEEARGIPGDKELAELPAPRLFGLYAQVRHQLLTNHSRVLIQELGMHQRRLKALEAARQAIDIPVPVIGATEAGRVHARILVTAIKAEQAESQLRSEAAMAMLLSLHLNIEEGNNG